MNKHAQNIVRYNSQASMMYVDMNSFFASCEQQDYPELRGKPVGVCTYASPNASVIAPSIEAKKLGVKTGMRLSECRMLCPGIIPVTTRPVRYRQQHINIMNILRHYCDDVMPRSIDEAVLNLASYRLVYKDFISLAKMIKADIRKVCGDYITCSIGIAPNAFLAKLATDLQKPDGLVQITPDNIDYYLSRLELTDLPGIARNNARRLEMAGLRTPLEMRHTSSAVLRKIFGGITGHYWHCRLNFLEVDFYKNSIRSMSAMRTVSPQQRQSKQSLESLLISLCTKLEQRMVKQGIFCQSASFYIRYKNYESWETLIRFSHPVQDAMEILRYIQERMVEFEKMRHIPTIFNNQTQSMGVVVQDFISDKNIQYTLFDNRIKQDSLRKVMYGIKDKYGKNSVRKASESIEPDGMKDAVGFGSVKDLYEGESFNKYMLEED